MGLFTKINPEQSTPPELAELTPEGPGPELAEQAPELAEQAPELAEQAPELAELTPEGPGPELAEQAPDVDVLTTTQKRLHSALVAIDGRLANPEDLPFNPEHLENDEALETAITAFLEAHPTLKKNYVAGDVGQGNRGSDKKPVDLIELMRIA